MTIGTLRAFGFALLLAAILSTSYALHAQTTRRPDPGPAALLAATPDAIWIAVPDAIWQTTADGRLKTRCSLGSLGLDRPPANLVRHPSGAVVATLRDQPTLHVLDAQGCRPLRRITPGWPADLQRHGGRAINLAFHPDGRVAIATGGGHAVALFDADGRFLARTAPGLYRFTNGLWWEGDRLWTTDTNRDALRVLHGRTLQAQSSVALPAVCGARFLGPARSAPSGTGSPAALVLFYNDMIRGHVALVDPAQARANGSQTLRLLPDHGPWEPIDLEWVDGTLLVSDGVSRSVLRWSAQGLPLPPFGDAQLQRELKRFAQQDQAQKKAYTRWLTVGIACFALAGIPLLLAERRRIAQTRGPDLSQLGTPLLSARETWRLMLRVHGGWALALLGMFILLHGRRWHWLPAPDTYFIPALLLLYLLALVMAIGKGRRDRPDLEPLQNAYAVATLRRQAADKLGLRASEQCLETFVWNTGMARWALLTNQRLLLARGLSPRSAWHRAWELADIEALSATAGGLAGKTSWLTRLRRLQGQPWLEVRLRSGEILAGSLASRVLASRLVIRLQRLRHEQQAATTHEPDTLTARSPGPGEPAVTAATPASASHLPVSATTISPTARRATQRHLDALASALLPGSGQWRQGRFLMGLLFFASAAAACVWLLLPVLWALDGPRRDVSVPHALLAFGVQAVLAWAAALDAWREG